MDFLEFVSIVDGLIELYKDSSNPLEALRAGYKQAVEGVPPDLSVSEAKPIIRIAYSLAARALGLGEVNFDEEAR